MEKIWFGKIMKILQLYNFIRWYPPDMGTLPRYITQLVSNQANCIFTLTEQIADALKNKNTQENFLLDNYPNRLLY